MTKTHMTMMAARRPGEMFCFAGAPEGEGVAAAVEVTAASVVVVVLPG